MNYRENTLAGPPPKSMNGACPCWSTCSIMWPPWEGKSIKDTSKDQSQRQSGWPLNIPPSRPFRIPWWRDPMGSRTSLQGKACCCTKCTPLPMTGLVHEEAAPRTCQIHGQGRSTEQGGDRRTLCKRPRIFLQLLHLTGLFPLIWISGDRSGQEAERRCSCWTIRGDKAFPF